MQERIYQVRRPERCRCAVTVGVAIRTSHEKNLTNLYVPPLSSWHIRCR